MEFLKPVERVRHEKVSHFITTIVEDVRTPVRMFTFSRVEILIQGCSIKASEGPRIFRKVSRYPIHDDAYTALMKMIDQVLEVIRNAVTCGGRIVVADLITP